MSSDRIYGDAKFTARAADADRKQRALSAAEKAYEENPTPQNHAAVATALFELGRFDEASKVFTEIMKTAGDDIKLACDLAFTYKNLQQKDMAIEMFKRVVKIDSRHSLARCAENELWSLDPEYKPSWMKK